MYINFTSFFRVLEKIYIFPYCQLKIMLYICHIKENTNKLTLGPI